MCPLQCLWFGPHHDVASNSFRLPYFHHNSASEFRAYLYGSGLGRSNDFYPGGGSYEGGHSFFFLMMPTSTSHLLPLHTRGGNRSNEHHGRDQQLLPPFREAKNITKEEMRPGWWPFLEI